MTCPSVLLRSCTMLCVAVFASAGMGCNGTPTTPTDVTAPPQPRLAPILSIQMLPALPSIRLGDSVTFTLNVALGEGIPPSGPMPVWSSTNPMVIGVDANGRATALALGEASLEVLAHGQRAARTIRVAP